MFDKYGEFDSSEEINKSAAGQLGQGDVEAVKEIAEENGLDPEDAEDYIDGTADELCNPLMAAFGKIKIESDELKPKEIICDWIDYIRKRCTESEDMAKAVRKKGKTLEGCIAGLLKWSFDNAYNVDNKIVKAAHISSTTVKMGIPGMATAYKLIDKYYLDGDAE